MNRPLVLLSIVIALSPAWTMATEWKDNTGKFSIEAELVDATDAKVVRRAAGRQVLVPRRRLSERRD